MRKMASKQKIELPDLFLTNTGRRLISPQEWEKHRRFLYKIIEIEYGGMPPAPSTIIAEELHTTSITNYGKTRFSSYRIRIDSPRPFYFFMQLFIPEGKGPFPVVLTGDACWKYATDEVITEVIKRGNIFAQFNRVEIVPDIYRTDRNSGLYTVYPDLSFGALSAWAWGYHRCIDVLVKMDCVNPEKIAIVGHSRGGKTTLLAGATDKRVALTCANNSGCGGAGSYFYQGPKSETMADSKKIISYWYGPQLWKFLGKEYALPFDQHFLKALVAPRALLTTEALGDLWANPRGTYQTYMAAREAYRFLGHEERIGIWYRKGGHNHGIKDWKVFLDFMDWQLRGKKVKIKFNENPFPDMQPAFSWSAP